MSSLTFYVPFPDAPAVEKELEYLYNQGSLQYVIYVKRSSRFGNPYIKGLVVVKDEDTLIPEVMEIKEAPPDSAEYIWAGFKTEQELEGNAVELGSPASETNLINS